MEFFTRLTGDYVEVLVNNKWLKEHRYVAEKILKRELTEKETIHHIDRNTRNNEPSNLALFPNQKEHAQFHLKLNQFGQTIPLQRLIDEKRITNIKLSLNK